MTTGSGEGEGDHSRGVDWRLEEGCCSISASASSMGAGWAMCSAAAEGMLSKATASGSAPFSVTPGPCTPSDASSGTARETGTPVSSGSSGFDG